MKLLRFSVRNHKSIRDEVSIELARPSLKTLLPKAGDWGAACYPIAGIFGGNATGKSAILDAFRYAVSAIVLSATEWQAAKNMVRAPFKLDAESQEASSLYELDVVIDGRRYLYGFEVDAGGIKREWMREVTSRWRTLLERDRDDNLFTFHQRLGGKIKVTPRELVLSRALLLDDSPLKRFAQKLLAGVDVVLVKDSHRAARLRRLVDLLVDGNVSFSDLEALLRVADIGVSKVRIEEKNVPERIRLALSRFQRELDGDAPHNLESARESAGEPQVEEPTEEVAGQVARRLIFSHRGGGKECPEFSIHEESDGTIAWLAIAVPALQALRRGGLLLVDEIDASLHPHLLDVLLGAFANPNVNTRHAQLIFTSHESYVLSPLSDVRLEPEQVWFTDKTVEGVTELTCLADFPKHPDANVAKRYLTGRYGGTPRLSPSLFAALIDSRQAEE
ncbi:MAG: ATP-binding protein [Buchananella hordeovulneris]|nr:ATP-binding protein [Buchananella hordeovulneris]